MCKCTPNIRTPFCGKENCAFPKNYPAAPSTEGWVNEFDKQFGLIGYTKSTQDYQAWYPYPEARDELKSFIFSLLSLQRKELSEQIKKLPAYLDMCEVREFRENVIDLLESKE